jgi:hypothetical protein
VDRRTPSAGRDRDRQGRRARCRLPRPHRGRPLR